MHQKGYSGSPWSFVLACTLSACLYAATPVQAADDYLSELDAEADVTGSLGHDDSAADSITVESVKRTPVVVRNSNVIRAGLSFQEFERELDTNFSGSYFLYDKLNRAQRKRVYELYQTDNRTTSVREKIVSLLASG